MNVRGRNAGITTVKARKLKGRGRQPITKDRAKRRESTHASILLSLSPLRGEGECDNWIIFPLSISVQEPPQPLDLRGKIHNDYLHPDFEVELEDLCACFESLCPRSDKHVPFEAELLKRVDQLAEFGTPSQHSKL